ncbi:hypothetical protein Tco_0593979 [Tanacetum coccineum]
MSLDNTTTKDDQSQTSAGCATSGVEKTSTLRPPAKQILKCGTLRNVPIGGGCRKKKTRSSSSSRDLSSLEIIRLSNLFTGLSPPAMDFQRNVLNQFSSPFMNLDSLKLKFFHGGLASVSGPIDSDSSTSLLAKAFVVELHAIILT